MKILKSITAIALTVPFRAAPLVGLADDAKPAKQLVPDKMTTCPVSGDKLGEMGKPFTMEYKGQEVKLCCKSCKKKFDADPEKYLKLIRAADKQ